MLQRKSEGFSMQGKKTLLGLFCLLFAGMSVAAIVQAFSAKAKPGPEAVHMPRIIPEKETPALPFISKQEYDRIEQFKNHVRQLPKACFDSFMHARPKLLDSITVIENYYLSQNKK